MSIVSIITVHNKFSLRNISVTLYNNFSDIKSLSAKREADMADLTNTHEFFQRIFLSLRDESRKFTEKSEKTVFSRYFKIIDVTVKL